LDWWSLGVVAGKWFRLDPNGNFADSLRLFHVPTERQAWTNGSALEPSFSGKINWISDLYWHVDVNEIPQFDATSTSNVWLTHDKMAELTDPFVPNVNPYQPFDAGMALGLSGLLQAPKPTAIPVVTRGACPAWRAPRAVAFTGLAGKGDSFALVDCEGVVSADAIDRLSVIGRQPGTPLPSLPLPLLPENQPLVEGEWVNGIRLLHPRLLGLIQQIALAYPGRSVAVYSGYRRDARRSSPHLRGRAIDMAVNGVANEQLFAFCRTMRDTGCGYYPNQPFVHVDVREPSHGSAAWIDNAAPGHPSVYTAIWPIPNGEPAPPEAD